MKIRDIEIRKKILLQHIVNKNHFVVLSMARDEELWDELDKILKPNQGELHKLSTYLPKILQSKHDNLVKKLHIRPGKSIQKNIFQGE